MRRSSPWTVPVILAVLVVAAVALYARNARTRRPTDPVRLAIRLNSALAENGGWSGVDIQKKVKGVEPTFFTAKKQGFHFLCAFDGPSNKLTIWVYLTEPRPEFPQKTLAGFEFHFHPGYVSPQKLAPELEKEIARLANELAVVVGKVCEVPVAQHPRCWPPLQLAP